MEQFICKLRIINLNINLNIINHVKFNFQPFDSIQTKKRICLNL